MIKPYEFYFNFASPGTFLAHKEIRGIELELVPNEAKTQLIFAYEKTK